jgi:predicted DNA-binding ArsR family transcriptional regulator
MWQKTKEQLPAIIITAILVVGAAFWIHLKTVNDMADRQQQEIAALREQTNAQLKATAEETRRQIDAVNTLLKDAIQKRAADVFMTQQEVEKMNAERVNQLAEAIAQKIQPYNPLPKTPEEAEHQQNEQVDKVSSRLAERIQPILADMAKDQHLTRDQIAAYSQKISDQISNVMTSELAAKQQLNNNLIATEAVARDSLKLAQEVTALYLSSFKDQSLITRILTLPANVVRDAAHLSIVDSNERKKLEEQLAAEMNALEKRLSDIEAQAPKQ